MYRIARLSNSERQVLFRNTSQKIGIHEARGIIMTYTVLLNPIIK